MLSPLKKCRTLRTRGALASRLCILGDVYPCHNLRFHGLVRSANLDNSSLVVIARCPGCSYSGSRGPYRDDELWFVWFCMETRSELVPCRPNLPSTNLPYVLSFISRLHYAPNPRQQAVFLTPNSYWKFTRSPPNISGLIYKVSIPTDPPHRYHLLTVNHHLVGWPNSPHPPQVSRTHFYSAP
ncbi:hypothetical protein BDN72DRAFT_34975 [Pluteus cervinus]|uniref:Uncharacterized protein n=1 Tax=Pluteus cervinus TaxID=181527 RepID=A0ACD3BJ96_9AGAR|nr:hypothetical protein BDN72DRAFT_34975 [Pluteus cervinus]